MSRTVRASALDIIKHKRSSISKLTISAMKTIVPWGTSRRVIGAAKEAEMVQAKVRRVTRLSRLNMLANNSIIERKRRRKVLEKFSWKEREAKRKTPAT